MISVQISTTTRQPQLGQSTNALALSLSSHQVPGLKPAVVSQLKTLPHWILCVRVWSLAWMMQDRKRASCRSGGMPFFFITLRAGKS